MIVSILLVKCVKCKKEKEVTEFYENKANKSGRTGACKECIKGRVKEWNKNNKEKHLERAFKSQVYKRYKITPIEYAERMATSDCCQICGNKKDLCYDHDHITGEFRGVLCRACNRSIGQLGDTYESLLKAVEYLKPKEEPP